MKCLGKWVSCSSSDLRPQRKYSKAGRIEEEGSTGLERKETALPH